MIRRSIRPAAHVVVALAVLFAIADGVRAAAEPVRILPIGDSITQGRKGGGKHKPTYSWRYPLWKMCVDADLPVDFVGSMTGGFNGDPKWDDYKGRAFDRDHEGHWGWTPRGVADKLPGWIETYDPPDIALILLGTNGAKKDDAIGVAVEAHEAMIATIRKRNAEAVIVIGLPFQEWKPFPKMREAYRAMAKRLSTQRSPVLTVDHAPGWVSKPDKPGTHTVDWVHPNEAGDTKLAGNWFGVIEPHIRRLAGR